MSAIKLPWYNEHCEWIDDAQTFLVDHEERRVYFHDPQRPVVQLSRNSSPERIAPIILYLATDIWIEDVIVDGSLKLKNLRIIQDIDEYQRGKLATVLDPHQIVSDGGIWRQTKGGINRWRNSPRALPHNVYATSGGRFIGRRGKKKTQIFPTVDQVLSALEREEWV